MALDILHDNWGPYTHTDVENALKAYLTVLDQKIQETAASGGVDPDDEMSPTSEKPVQNKVIKAYVDAVSARIDTLIGSGNVQGVIDTFNEVTAFLNGIDTSEPTLRNQLLALYNALDEKQDELVDGESVKSINGESILGAGDIDTKQIIRCKVIIGPKGTSLYPAIGYDAVTHEWTFGASITPIADILYVDVLTDKQYSYYGNVLHEIGGGGSAPADIDVIRAGAALGATSLQPVTLFVEERSGSLYFTDDAGPINDHDEVKRILGDVHNSVIVVYDFRPYTCKRPFSVEGDEFWLGTYLEDNTFYSLNLGLDGKEIYIDETMVCEMASSEQLDNVSRRVVVEVYYTNSIDNATYSVDGVIISLATLYGYIQDESTEVVLKVLYYEEENGNNHGPYNAYLSLSSMWVDTRRYYGFRGDVIGHYTSDGFVQMIFGYDSRTGLYVEHFGWDINTVENLSTVAYSGSYNDLEDKPTIPAAYDDSALDQRVSVLEGFMEETPSIEDIPTNTSDLTNDSDFTTQAYVDAQIAQVEIGETVVVNTDGANIVDSHTNPSVLFAPSARQMAMVANNITTLFTKLNDLFDKLAGIAFTDTKPTAAWKVQPNWSIPAIQTYTLTLDLSKCSADFRNGPVNEGGLHITFTPQSSSYAISNVIVNDEVVDPVPTGLADGSVYVDIVVNSDVHIVAVASSGFNVSLGQQSSGVTLQSQNVVANEPYRGTLVRMKYYELPTSISATMGGQSVTFGSTNTYDNETGEIVIPNVTGDIVITAVGVTQTPIQVSMDGTNCSFWYDGNELDTTESFELYPDDRPFEIEIVPDKGFRLERPTLTDGSGTGVEVLGPFTDGTYKLMVGSDSAESLITIVAYAVEDIPAVLTAPTNGTTVDIGTIGTGQSSVQKTLRVAGTHFTRPVELSVIGASGFTLSKYELTAEEVNAGIDVTVTYTNTGSASVSVSGTLEIEGDDLETAVAVTLTAAKQVMFQVSYQLTNVASSNNAASVEAGESFSTVLSALQRLHVVDDDSITITMGGTDITANVYGNDAIFIGQVTGDIVITASAVTYVANGLKMHLDESAVNLVDNEWQSEEGDYTFALTDVTKVTGGKGAVFNGSTSKAVCTEELNVLSSDGTIEFVMTPRSILNGGVVLFNATVNYGISAVGWSANSINTVTKETALKDSTNIATLYPNNQSSYAAHYSLSQSRIFVNGVESTDNGNNNNARWVYYSPMQGKMAIGHRLSGAAGSPLYYAVTVKSIRVYERQLSEAEILQNYKVDKKLFNL